MIKNKIKSKYLQKKTVIRVALYSTLLVSLYLAYTYNEVKIPPPHYTRETFRERTLNDLRRDLDPVVIPKGFDHKRMYRLGRKEHLLLNRLDRFWQYRNGNFMESINEGYIKERRRGLGNIDSLITRGVNVESIKLNFRFSDTVDINNIIVEDNKNLIPEDYLRNYSFYNTRLFGDTLFYFWNPTYNNLTGGQSYLYSPTRIRKASYFIEKLRELTKRGVFPFCSEKTDFKINNRYPYNAHHVEVSQTYRNIPIEGSVYDIRYSMSDDTVLTDYSLHTIRTCGDLQIEEFTPKYSPQQIHNFILSDLTRIEKNVRMSFDEEPKLVIICPDILAYRATILVTKNVPLDEIKFRSNEPGYRSEVFRSEYWRYYIDAHTAKLYERSRVFQNDELRKHLLLHFFEDR